MRMIVGPILFIFLFQSTLLESFQLTSPLVVVHDKPTCKKRCLSLLQMVEKGKGQEDDKNKQLSLPKFFGMNLGGNDSYKIINGVANNKDYYYYNINGDEDGNKNNNSNNKPSSKHNDKAQNEPTENAAMTTKTESKIKSKKNKVWNTTIFPAKEFGRGQQSLPSFLGVGSNTVASSSRSSIDSNAATTTTTTTSTTNVDGMQVSFPTMIQKEIYTQIIAGMIGGFTGISIAVFKLSIEGIREFCYGGSLNFISPQDEIVPYYVVPVLGAIGVTFLSLTGDFSPGLKGVVKEVDGYSLTAPSMSSSSASSSLSYDAVQNSPWTWRPVRKALAAIVTLGTGNSLGPEGPGVEIGAAISRIGMSVWPFQSRWNNEGEKAAKEVVDTAGRVQKKDDGDSLVERITRNRLLLACGAAAGVSSGFNAPLSGVFFALEVVQSSLPLLKVPSEIGSGSEEVVALEPKSLSASSGSIAAILISSVVAALVARVFLGDELALRVFTYDISTPLSELPLYILLGSFCGVVSVAFSQSAKFFKALFEGSAGTQLVQDIFGALPAPLLPIIGGVVSGGVGYFYPQILFFGYETLNGLLQNDNLPTVVLLSLLLAKMTTTAVSAGSGLVGGILAPSLFLGGMTGAIFHNVVCHTFISLSIEETIVGPSGLIFDLAGVPIYSSVGAASVLAAIFRAPLTAALLLFEITRNYDVLLPILASAGIATLSSDILENKIESKS